MPRIRRRLFFWHIYHQISGRGHSYEARNWKRFEFSVMWLLDDSYLGKLETSTGWQKCRFINLGAIDLWSEKDIKCKFEKKGVLQSLLLVGRGRNMPYSVHHILVTKGNSESPVNWMWVHSCYELTTPLCVPIKYAKSTHTGPKRCSVALSERKMKVLLRMEVGHSVLYLNS